MRKGEWGVRGGEKSDKDKGSAWTGCVVLVRECVCMLKDSVGALLKGI